jgi:hypothetical protein
VAGRAARERSSFGVLFTCLIVRSYEAKYLRRSFEQFHIKTAPQVLQTLPPKTPIQS